MLAAADLPDFDADFDPNVRPAAEAADLPVCLELPRCARALAAADLADFVADLEPKVRPAAEAARRLVRSVVFAITISF